MLALVLLIRIISRHKPYSCMSNALKNKKRILINALIFFLQLMRLFFFFEPVLCGRMCIRYTTLIPVRRQRICYDPHLTRPESLNISSAHTQEVIVKAG